MRCRPPRPYRSRGGWLRQAVETAGLAIRDQLDARIRIFGIEIFEALFGKHNGSRDIILDLHFVGWIKIWTEFINAPGAIGIIAHTQVIGEQLLVFEFELIPGRAIYVIDAEVLAPIVTPLLLVVAFDRDQ